MWVFRGAAYCLTARHSLLKAASCAPAPAPQLDAVAHFVDGGGALLVLGREGETTTTTLDGGARSPHAPLNALTRRFGIELNPDAVLRTVFYKYLHPKEAFIAQGCVSPGFEAAAAELHASARSAAHAALGAGADAAGARDATRGATRHASVDVVYPRGCTLAVARPAVTLLTSGFASYPVQCPVLAVCPGAVAAAPNGSAHGRVAVLGSGEMLSDAWLGREANAAVGAALFRWLAGGVGGGEGAPAASAPLPDGRRNPAAVDVAEGARRRVDVRAAGGGDAVARALATVGAPAAAPQQRHAAGAEWDAGSGGGSDGLLDGGGRGGGGERGASGADDGADTRFLPDIGALAERLRGCLQEPEALPPDLHATFDGGVFAFSTRLIPEAVALFPALAVKHEPLSLIPPMFEAPLPPLQPAVFPPILREPPPPPLELFDLDEQFASERVRLAQLANKCGPEDLDYFVRECGMVCGLMVRAGALADAGCGAAARGRVPRSDVW